MLSGQSDANAKDVIMVRSFIIVRDIGWDNIKLLHASNPVQIYDFFES